MIQASLALAGALTATALGQVCFKLFFKNKQYHYLIMAIALFCIAPLCSYVALGELSVGFVYMSTALTIVMVVLLSAFVLGECLTRDHGIAMLMIVAGVVLYAQ